eukprot:Sro673_g185321.2  (413) ;mRNA; r:48182-49420
MMFSEKICWIGFCLVGSLTHVFATRYESGVLELGIHSLVPGHSITVDDDFVICDVDIEVSFSHGYSSPGDLDVGITFDADSPVTTGLARNHSCGLFGPVHARFDDSSSNTLAVNSNTCVSDGSDVKPDGDLSLFNGHSSQGSWTLSFNPSRGYIQLQQWAVILTPCDDGAGTGDPHFKTWAGKWYDFHGACDLVFLSNPSFAHGTGLDIHIRTKARYQYSFIESAAVRIGEDILEVGEYGGYLVNGISNADLEKLDKYTVTHEKINSKQDVFTIELGAGKQIVVQSFKDLVSVKTVGASLEEYGGSMGLLGEFGSGKWLSRNGTVMSDAIAFGNEWQVLEVEPKLFQTNQFPQHPVQCTMPSTSNVGRRRLGESIAEASAEKVCGHWGDLKDQCVYDVMATGDLELAQAGAF